MRFAYLIMAHHRFDVLKELLKDLDDERNDIFLHIDKKAKHVPTTELKKCINKANLVLVRPIKVYWGHSSQIECVLKLMKAAYNKGFHDYYHLLVGVEFPIVDQDEIFRFFQDNNGKEFIGYDRNDSQFLNRIKYYYLWGKYARNNSKIQQRLYLDGVKLVHFQIKMRVNRISNDTIEYRKGYANWSITDKLVKYILSKERYIRKRMWLTSCADEVIFHTIIYNSEFRENVYDLKDEYHSCMRLTTWNDENNRLTTDDINYIIDSGRLFARKLDGDDAMELIKMIKARRNK